ncbi:MAG: MBL fold metallo-hydrolase [Candidatus Eremiobacteraeota bacterium]|nr:MBL fold metallo-hydrolase [Candidatus Eremiobacteraeota bacterium]
MKIVMEMEDTFGDIIRKASQAIGKTAQVLSRETGIDSNRIADFITDKAPPTENEARTLAKALNLDPGKLADIALGRWHPQEREQPSYIGHQINKPHPSNGYFVILHDQQVAAFVDPGGAQENIISALKRAPVKLQYILLTHKHRDHCDALRPVRAAFPDAQPVIHRLDASALGDAVRGAIGINDGDTLPFGNGEIRLLHTPGHTDGSSCFIYKSSLFSGDTLFAGSVGKIFGERFGYQDLLHGVGTKLFSLPEDMVVLPGHGPPSTIAEERAHNPFF